MTSLLILWNSCVSYLKNLLSYSNGGIVTLIVWLAVKFEIRFGKHILLLVFYLSLF
jgi:hypothetical protein